MACQIKANGEETNGNVMVTMWYICVWYEVFYVDRCENCNGDIQTRVVEQHKLEIASDVTVLATESEQALIWLVNRILFISSCDFCISAIGGFLWQYK